MLRGAYSFGAYLHERETVGPPLSNQVSENTQPLSLDGVLVCLDGVVDLLAKVLRLFHEPIDNISETLLKSRHGC